MGIIAPPFYLPPSYSKAVELTSVASVSSPTAPAPPPAPPSAPPPSEAALAAGTGRSGVGQQGASTAWENGGGCRGKGTADGLRIDNGGDVVMDAGGQEREAVGRGGDGGERVIFAGGGVGGGTSLARWGDFGLVVCCFRVLWSGESGKGLYSEGH